MKNNWKKWLPIVLLAGCASVERDCASCNASSFGSDWIVVQFKTDGEPINCWRLPNVSMSNEQGSDGIYWQSPDGHLVHLSGWYNRVQVGSGNWKGAADALGVDLDRCTGGRYLPAKE